MELFVGWNKKDYLEYVLTVLALMALVFGLSYLYKRQTTQRLRTLEIPLKSN